MNTDLNWLNRMTAFDAVQELLKCCGSRLWALAVAERRPYSSLDQLHETARDVWWSLEREDWLEAFRSHPKIGERKAERETSEQAKAWSEHEQSSARDGSDATREALAELNSEYLEKFGYIFIVCATGKTSDEMLSLLKRRLRNTAENELPIAAGEQAKITELRLTKLLTPHK